MAETNAAVAETAEKPRVKKLAEGEFKLTESEQIFQTAIPPVGTTREDMLNPVFWTHVARYMRPMSEIRVMPRDGARYGLYLVIFADRVSARVKELGFWPLENIKPEDVDNGAFFVKWIAPPVRFGVMRKVDNTVVKDGFQTKEDAIVWMKQNMREAR